MLLAVRGLGLSSGLEIIFVALYPDFNDLVVSPGQKRQKQAEILVDTSWARLATALLRFWRIRWGGHSGSHQSSAWIQNPSSSRVWQKSQEPGCWGVGKILFYKLEITKFILNFAKNPR